MAELFAGYKGGSFGSVLPSMMNAALQRQNTPPRYNIPRNERPGRSPAVATSGAERQDRMVPFNYAKFKEQTLGATLAGINELRNETETETVQIPIETPPAGGMTAAADYYSLDQNARDLTEMITGLEQESALLEKGIEAIETGSGLNRREEREAYIKSKAQSLGILDSSSPQMPWAEKKYGAEFDKANPPGQQQYTTLPGENNLQTIANKFGVSLESLIRANPAVQYDKVVNGQTLYIPTLSGPAPDPNAPDPVEQRKQWTDSFNNAQQQKMEAEGTLASVKLLQEKNLEAGGGPIETEVHEAYREVPTDNESRRDAAMKMVAEVAGKIGGQAAAQLYQEVDRLYPSTEPVQGTPLLDPEGNQIGVKPPWSDTTITTRRGMWDPSRVDSDGHEEISRRVDASGNVSITYAPRETPKRLVLFPGGNQMYAMSDASAAKMNEHLDGMFSSMQMLDKILEIAETADWETRKLDFSTRAKAKLYRTLLIGKMRVTLVGPGVVSNFDYEQLMKAIDDPTEVFNIDNIITGGESSIVKIRILKEQMNNALLDKAANAGFTAPESKYRLPVKYRKFDSLETAREFGFKAGDIVWIKGINPNKKPYEYQRLKLKERTIGNP